MSIMFDPDPRVWRPSHPGHLPGLGSYGALPHETIPEVQVLDAAGYEELRPGATLSFGQSVVLEGQRRNDVLEAMRHAIWTAGAEMKASGYRMQLSPAGHLDVHLAWYAGPAQAHFQAAEGELRLRVAALAKRIEVLAGKPELVGFARPSPAAPNLVQPGSVPGGGGVGGGAVGGAVGGADFPHIMAGLGPGGPAARF